MQGVEVDVVRNDALIDELMLSKYSHVTKHLEKSSIEKATNQVLENIRALLNAADMTPENVLKCSIFLKNMDDFEAVNTIYSQFFNGIYPARETVEVARLPLDVPIEISCIASK